MDLKKQLELLGLEAEDRVTGAKGVISSIAFDLYGCIQASLAPRVKKDGEMAKSYWYDLPRLKVSAKKRVMPLPDFVKNLVQPSAKGPAEKPPID